MARQRAYLELHARPCDISMRRHARHCCILDFFMREIAPSVYNHAIADAHAYVAGRLDDLDGVCHLDEFSYWPPEGRRR